MAFGYLAADRDQLFLLPVDMKDWLPKGHLVWFVLDVVAQLDTSALHARHPNDGPGRAAYDPDMLLGLLVYAYCTGQRSSRQIERLCEVDIAYRVACANHPPDHTTLARFRQVHAAVAQELFAQVLALCARAGLLKVGVVAIDGTKMAAQASMSANKTLPQLRHIVSELFARAEEADAAEDRAHGPARGDELPPELADPTKRAERIKAALAQLEAAEEAGAARGAELAERSERAEAAAHAEGALPRGRPPLGREVARAEKALELARKRAVARRGAIEAAYAKAGKKLGGRAPDLEKAKAVKLAHERLRRVRAARAERDQADQAAVFAGQPKANLTDPDSRLMHTRSGYLQAYNAQAAVGDNGLVIAAELTQEANDLRQLVPMLDAVSANLAVAGASVPVGTVLADAGYFSEANVAAPGPDRLIATKKSWALRNKTKTEGYKTGPAPEGASPVEAMEHRICSEAGSALYARRASTVEPVFGQHKAARGYRAFMQRGLVNVTGEWKLMNTVHNLLKLYRAQAPA
jgi:transposase